MTKPTWISEKTRADLARPAWVWWLVTSLDVLNKDTAPVLRLIAVKSGISSTF